MIFRIRETGMFVVPVLMFNIRIAKVPLQVLQILLRNVNAAGSFPCGRFRCPHLSVLSSCFLLYLINFCHKGHLARISAGEHQMNVCDHISYNVGCLVEIFAGTPYIAFFDSLEVCKSSLFCRRSSTLLIGSSIVPLYTR